MKKAKTAAKIAISSVDRFEAKLLKRSAYRHLHAKTESITKIAANLIRYRAENGLSQAALAKTAGISRKALNEIEVLENTNPGLRTMESLANAMQIPVEKLFV
jgi:DNA-binding XRE family transcriptional regulator